MTNLARAATIALSVLFWFTLSGTGKGGTTGDGSNVRATFFGYKRGAEERFRRAPTG